MKLRHVNQQQQQQYLFTKMAGNQKGQLPINALHRQTVANVSDAMENTLAKTVGRRNKQVLMLHLKARTQRNCRVPVSVRQIKLAYCVIRHLFTTK